MIKPFGLIICAFGLISCLGLEDLNEFASKDFKERRLSLNKLIRNSEIVKEKHFDSEAKIKIVYAKNLGASKVYLFDTIVQRKTGFLIQNQLSEYATEMTFNLFKSSNVTSVLVAKNYIKIILRNSDFYHYNVCIYKRSSKGLIKNKNVIEVEKGIFYTLEKY